VVASYLKIKFKGIAAPVAAWAVEGVSNSESRFEAVRAAALMLRQGEFTMSEQAVEDRRGWASDIMWVALYSILVLLAMLLWI
jgi:hypothetical protein